MTIFCKECILQDPSEYLEYIAGSTVPETFGMDLSAHGYRKLLDCESGFHEGQDDNPKFVVRRLKDKGITDFILQANEASQFWSVWVADIYPTEQE
jgi:hypothetical protein